MITESAGPNDDALVLAIQQGDHAAFRVCFKQHWEELYIVALNRILNPDTAKDMVQEVFLSLWERHNTLNISGSLKAYLLTAVKFKVIDYYRKGVTLEKHRVELARLMQTSESESSEENERERLLRNAIGSLPEKMRHVFEKNHFDQKTVSEISNDLNISQQTVRNHLSSAMKILREQLVIVSTLIAIIFR